MSRPLKVVTIRSLSYTGTTWLNLVLGCHRRAFALGPPERVWKLAETRFQDACRVHRHRCPFWDRLGETYDPGRNLLLQIADAAEAEAIVINNPTPAFSEAVLRHPDIRELPVILVRDGRAVVASYMRKFPDKTIFDAACDWVAPHLRTIAYDPDDPDRLCLRYEALQADPLGGLAAMAGFVGLDYEEGALRFWEHRHHITAGNTGPIALLWFGEGIAGTQFRDRPYYERKFAEMQRDPMAVFGDDRWHTELTERERFVFDLICGADNARLGYARDRFALTETTRFIGELRTATEAGEIPAVATTALAASTLWQTLASVPGAAAAQAVLS